MNDLATMQKQIGRLGLRSVGMQRIAQCTYSSFFLSRLNTKRMSQRPVLQVDGLLVAFTQQLNNIRIESDHWLFVVIICLPIKICKGRRECINLLHLPV